MATTPITAVGIIALVEAIGIAEVVMIVGAIGIFAALHAVGGRRRKDASAAQRPPLRMREYRPSATEPLELPRQLPEPARDSEPARLSVPVLTGSIPTR